MRRPPSARFGLAVGMLAAAVLVASALAGPAGGQQETAPLCMTPGLDVWLDTQGSGTAGSVYYALEFTNLSGRACSLDGYPYIYAVSIGGANLGSRASFDAVHPALPVVLARGATATAFLRVVDAANFPTASCREVTAAGLRVYPPNQTTYRIVPFPFLACSRVGTPSLSVETVQKRAPASG